MQDIRGSVLKGVGASGAGIAAPSFFIRNAWAADFRNDPRGAKTVMLGFNVPQSGPYADEGADELKASKLAAQHRPRHHSRHGRDRLRRQRPRID